MFVRAFKIKILFASLLALGIFSVGISSLAMDHSMQGHEACVAANALGADCSVLQDNGMCLDYHLGILNELSQAIRRDGKLALFILVLLPIFAWFINRFPLLFRRFLHIRVRMRWLWENLISSYFKQLWFLTLQQRRDPAFAVVLMQSGL